MAEVKISALPTATALDGTELSPIVQGGVTKKTQLSATYAPLALTKHVPAPTGVAATDTANIQATLAAAGAAVTTISPSLDVQSAAIPEVRFQAGRYNLNAPLTFLTAGLSYCRLVSEGQTILAPTGNTDVFDASGTYMLDIEGIDFVGGKRHVVWGNNNVDSAMLHMRRCEFHGSTDWNIETVLTGGAANLSAVVVVETSKFYNNYRILKVAPGAEAFVKNSWVSLPNSMVNGAAFEVASGGVLGFDNVYGVPPAAAPANARWVDNYTSFYAKNSRFGGEGGGIPIVRNFAGPQQVYPWDQGGVISIRDSFCSIGPAANRALIYLATGVPQVIDISGNTGITRDSQNYIVDGIAGGVAAYIAALVAETRIQIDIHNNAGLSPIDATGIPAGLVANTTKVACNLNLGPYSRQVVISALATPKATTGTWAPSWTSGVPGMADLVFNNPVLATDAITFWDVPLDIGTWRLDLMAYRDANAAIATISLNGVTVGTLDLYGVTSGADRFTLSGIAVAAPGLYAVKLSTPTKNASSGGYRCWFNEIVLTRTA